MSKKTNLLKRWEEPGSWFPLLSSHKALDPSSQVTTRTLSFCCCYCQRRVTATCDPKRPSNINTASFGLRSNCFSTFSSYF